MPTRGRSGGRTSSRAVSLRGPCLSLHDLAERFELAPEATAIRASCEQTGEDARYDSMGAERLRDSGSITLGLECHVGPG